MRRRRNVAGNRATARMGSVLFGGGSSAASRKKAGRWWARAWNLPSLRSVLLLQSKEGRQQIADYWDAVLTDLINLLTGAKAQAGEAGQVQEGFQYPMRLLAGLALSLTGLLVMLVGFDSAYRRTRFGLERLRAEVVRYRTVRFAAENLVVRVFICPWVFNHCGPNPRFFSETAFN